MVSFDMNKKYSHELATLVSSYAVLQLQVLPANLDPAGPLFILYSLYTNRTSSFQASIIDVLKLLHVGTVGLGHLQALVLVQGEGVALQTVNTMAAVERVLATRNPCNKYSLHYVTYDYKDFRLYIGIP